MFNFLKGKRISAKLVKGGLEVKTKIGNVTNEQLLILLSLLIKNAAKRLKMPHRQLLNGLVSIDKEIVRSEKKIAKANRYKK